jgi:exodeoxyribonuclease V alpha subunit
MMDNESLNVEPVASLVDMIGRRYGASDDVLRDVVRPLVAATDEEHVALAVSASTEAAAYATRHRDLIQTASFEEEISPLGAPIVMVGDRFWYLRRLARAEHRVAMALHRAQEEEAEPVAGLTHEEIATALAEVTRELNEQGISSPELGGVVANMVFRKISFVTGGPGTGKTWIVAQALRVIDRALSARASLHERVSIGLSAPTGKASRRVSSALTRSLGSDGLRVLSRDADREGSLHQLLGVRPDWMHSPRALGDDVTVVDEVSMADLVMLDLLMAAAQGDHGAPSHLVLVGDPNQLASVNVGAVLSDVVNAEAGLESLITRLTTTHRYQAGGEGGRVAMVGDLADAVIGNRPDDTVAMLSAGGVHLHSVASPTDAALREMVLSNARKVIALAEAGEAHAALSALSQLTVLCGTRRGPGSVEWWNEYVRDELVDSLTWCGSFYVGQPVIVRKNQNALKVSNGDVGVVIGGEQPMVVFDEGRAIPLSSLGYLSSAWAMTIHKSQGSEYEHVVVVLPMAGSPLLTRELFYTAVTRAKDEVTVVGDSAVIREALGRDIERVSGLTERLRWLKTAAIE